MRRCQIGQNRGKLSPHYIEPFKIPNLNGKFAYSLVLPPKMFGVHNVFHNMLKKYIHDDTHVIDFNDIEMSDNVLYHNRPVRILDYGTKKLRNKEFTLVKVQWMHYDEGEASWELESEMWEKFPELLTGQNLFRVVEICNTSIFSILSVF